MNKNDLIAHVASSTGASKVDAGRALDAVLDGIAGMVFVTDNNFAPERQVTKFIAFEIRPQALQGCSTGS